MRAPMQKVAQDELSPVLQVATSISDTEIERLIEARAAARKAKDFAESDRIRDLLAEQGIVLEDRPGGQRTLWRRGR
jgi:cysteinyl-tRNA synthetase